MKKIAMIPARYAATRFPYKLMQALGNKTVIRHTYDNTLVTGLFDEVFVVTDHEIIFNEIVNHGGKAIMSIKQHESGSDRIAEAVAEMEVAIIVNVQGDEPFVKKEPLRKLLQAFDGNEGEKVQVASLMKKFTDIALVKNPNYVKVVVDKNRNALFFSRSAIPYQQDETMQPLYYEHIGVYAFRKQALLNFTKWPAAKMELAEKLEQLRYLENGITIKMVETDEATVKIDVPEDLVMAEAYLKSL
ncbi:MAG: 3-deoxy-manno-octulosonate cytidylyltransferase [Ferruginibacter sp.]